MAGIYVDVFVVVDALDDVHGSFDAVVIVVIVVEVVVVEDVVVEVVVVVVVVFLLCFCFCCLCVYYVQKHSPSGRLSNLSDVM